MRTLIIYASKYGCTADCATYLKDQLLSDVELVDINKTDKKIELATFDTILIGGSIYAGKLYSKELRTFCQNHVEALCKKRIGLFLCCAQPDTDDLFLKNFPSALLDHAEITKTFGSEARLETMKLLDKTILKAVTKGDFSSFKISHENIKKFAEKFN